MSFIILAKTKICWPINRSIGQNTGIWKERIRACHVTCSLRVEGTFMMANQPHDFGILNKPCDLHEN